MNKLERIKELYGKNQKKAQKHEPSSKHLSYDDRRAVLIDDDIHIYFNAHLETVALIKRITERSFHDSKGKEQHWSAPVSLDAIDKLREGNFNFDRELIKWESDIFAPVELDPKFRIPGIQHWDFFEQYQKDGVQIIEAKNGRILVADDPGLGKTMQVLAWLQLRKEVRRVLIVCPATLKLNWKQEAEFWMKSPKVQIVEDLEDVKIWGEIVVVNYDILTRFENGDNVLRRDLWRIKWKCIVLDEAHYISNKDSIRGWAIDALVSRVKHVIPITATPGNRVRQIFTLANMIDRRIFPSWFKYAHRYCGAKKDYVGNWNFNGSSNEQELNDILSASIMLRRKKQDVFKSLEKIRRSVVLLNIDNRKEYQKRDAEGEMTFQKVEKLSKLAVKGKMKAALEWIKNLLESEEKIIIFAEHKEVIDTLMKEFGSIAIKIDGSVDLKQRNAAVDAFQRCKVCGVRKERHAKSPDACKKYTYDLRKRVIIGSTAMKEGVTLTAAYHIVFLELWWNPKDHEQGEGRPYGRAGDMHGATAWYLMASETIEEKRAEIYDLKNKALERVMNGRELSRDEQLTLLMREQRR